MQHEVPEEKGIIVSSWKYFFLSDIASQKLAYLCKYSEKD